MTNQDQSAIPPVVEASNLMLGYGQKMILRNVHLKIMAGDFWFIVGRNGSGKTTLVKSLLRQLIPMEGKLSFGGTFVNNNLKV
jgi:ABC-type cobalamin/Fe3+-siderophores transport system ATPase subunit